VPVIAAIHGLCIGAGSDITAGCDVRLAAKDAKFCIKEIDIGMAADLGTLQLMQKVVGNDSWLREVSYTGRVFGAEEALEKGYVSEVLESRDKLWERAQQLATLIAQKSPVAIAGIKLSVNYSRDHTIQEGLEHIAILNGALL